MIHYIVCSDNNCQADYVDKRRIQETVRDYDSKDKKFHILKHSMEVGHCEVSIGDFKVVGCGCKNNKNIKETL